MSNLSLYCPCCGAADRIEKDGALWHCRYCGRHFRDESAEEAYRRLAESLDARLQGALDEAMQKQRTEEFYHLRSLLWEKAHAKFIDSEAIVALCREIRAIEPNDFLARFYEIANSGTDDEISDFLNEIEPVREAIYLDLVIDFMLASLTLNTALSLNYLIERAYRATDLAAYEEAITRLEDEVAKLESGTYETLTPRDVFIAYSSKDAPAVMELARALEAEGLSCFVAMRNLRHGRGAVANYEAALCEAISNCKVLVFVSTKNSRSFACDAFKKELSYIRSCDLAKAPAQYQYRYDSLPAAYRMPRVEYRLDDTRSLAVDAFMKEFFAGLDYCESIEKTILRVAEYLMSWDEQPEETETEAPTAPASTAAPVAEELPIHLDDFEIENGRLIKYKGNEKRVRIPDSVSEIVDHAFEGCNLITELVIPDSVSKFGSFAFSKCTSLKEVRIPQAMVRIGAYAFYQCSALTTVHLHEGVCEIADGAFAGCAALANIKIPDRVTEIGSNAFEDCTALPFTEYQNAYYFGTPNEPYWFFVRPKNTSIQEIKIHEKTRVIQSYAFAKCAALTEVVIPDTVVKIGSYAFRYCASLHKVTIPTSVSAISWNAFEQCGELASITLPSSITKLDYGAFMNCTALTEIVLPPSLNKIARCLFRGCTALRKVHIPGSVTVIAEEAFRDCVSLHRITIPPSVKQIAANAFQGSPALDGGDDEEITDPAPAAEAPSEPVTDTPSVPATETPIDAFEIKGDLLVKYRGDGGRVTIPKVIKKIGNNAFAKSTALLEVTLADSVTEIGLRAFSDCTALIAVHIPKSVTEIGDGAFMNCTALTEIRIPETVTMISKAAFRGCTALSNVTIPNSVTTIGMGAFMDCSALKNLHIPDTVKKIGIGAFSGCPAYKKNKK